MVVAVVVPIAAAAVGVVIPVAVIAPAPAVIAIPIAAAPAIPVIAAIAEGVGFAAAELARAGVIAGAPGVAGHLPLLVSGAVGPPCTPCGSRREENGAWEDGSP